MPNGEEKASNATSLGKPAEIASELVEGALDPKRGDGGSALDGRPNERHLAWYKLWFKQRWSTYRIAEQENVHPSSVKEACKKVRAWLKDTFIDEILEERDRQLATLDDIASEALVEWERSKEPGVTVTIEDGPPNGDGSPKVESKKTVTVHKTGDPAMLNVVRGALADIRDILGIDAPKKVESNSTGEFRLSGMPLEEAREKAIRNEIETLQQILSNEQHREASEGQ